jgi:hypothetical protein
MQSLHQDLRCRDLQQPLTQDVRRKSLVGVDPVRVVESAALRRQRLGSRISQSQDGQKRQIGVVALAQTDCADRGGDRREIRVD